MLAVIVPVAAAVSAIGVAAGIAMIIVAAGGPPMLLDAPISTT